MALVPLTQNKFAIVDDEDFEKVSKYKWFFSTGYAKHLKYIKGSGRKHQKQISILMHRLIMNTPEGMDTDHKNGNPLDNRKINLRICSTRQNCFNREKREKTTSKYKGVYWDKQMNKWRSRIKVINKSIHLGLFSSEKEAAKEYDKNALKFFGEFAKLNFSFC